MSRLSPRLFAFALAVPGAALIAASLIIVWVGGDARITAALRLSAYVGLMALIAGAAGTIWARHLRARQGRECLVGAMRSVPEAVIVTDARGTVTAMNERAERMTGWAQSEAIGQPIIAVFHLVDARTYRPVVHPVVRALYKKVVVGPSHETLLIGRDGVERQVREMAAPIFDDAGRVFAGAVAFRVAKGPEEHVRVNSTRLSASWCSSSASAGFF